MEKILDTATKIGLNVAKTASKMFVIKTAEVTGELIGNEIAEEIVQPKPAPETNSRNIEEIIIPLEKRQKISNELR